MGTWRRAAVAPILMLLLAGLGGTRSARGETFRIDSSPDCEETSLKLAALPGGGLVAVWQAGATSAAGSSPRIFARLFDANHVAAGPAFQVSGDRGIGPAVAVGAAGDFLIAWGDAVVGRLVARHFNAAGGADGPEIVLSPLYPSGGVAVAATPTGFAVLAIQQTLVLLWRLAPTGSSLGPAEVVGYTIQIPEETSPIGRDPVMAYSPAGLVLSWAEEHFGVATTGALLYNGAIEGLPVWAQEQPADDPQPLAPALAVDRQGRILVAWNESPVAWIVAPVEGWGGLRAQVFNPDGTALQEVPLWVSNSGPLGFSPPAVAADGEGFVVAWQSLSSSPGDISNATWMRRIGTDGALAGPAVFVGNSPSVSRPAVAVDEAHRVTVGWQAGVQPQYAPAVATCFSQGLYAASLAPSTERLPLQNGRFEARVHWIDHAGHSGEGHAVPLSNDAGYFWFFGETNVEVMVKVLDGRAVNGSFWVFNGSLSDVVYTLTVTDTVTGRVSTYANRPGQLASFADTQAFPEDESVSASVSAAAELAVAPRPSQVAADQPLGPCGPPQSSRRPGLCLGDRFEVEVAWHANGTEGAGKGVGLTGDSGYLWFFAPSNTELVVKVLDGRALNGHFWVFYGALTDVEYTVRVRDTLTGAERVYQNPAGRLRSRADTAAF